MALYDFTLVLPTTKLLLPSGLARKLFGYKTRATSGSFASEHLFFRLYNSETIRALCECTVDFPTVRLVNFSGKCTLLSRL